ncbi:hypothetical protein [Gemmata massiliana]|nr:hypothetical protein [Gemmata massiliana]
MSRESGVVALAVVDRTDQAPRARFVRASTVEGAMVYTDEWKGTGG